MRLLFMKTPAEFVVILYLGNYDTTFGPMQLVDLVARIPVDRPAAAEALAEAYSRAHNLPMEIIS